MRVRAVKLALASTLALLILGILLPSVDRMEEGWRLAMASWVALAFMPIGLIATGKPGNRRLEALGWFAQLALLFIVLR